MTERSSGILLHITSLPGNYGVGTLGHEAYKFVDDLKNAGQTYWQILPIGPVSSVFGYSPYSSNSTFAGSELFISLEKLAADGLVDLTASDIFPDEHFCDFERAEAFKKPHLEKAAERFFASAAYKKDEYELFCRESSDWLEDYSLFASVSEFYNTTDWTVWDKDISLHEKKAVTEWSTKLQKKIQFYNFTQYIFFKQWMELKEYCADKGIKIIGDIPIYITLEGAAAWAHPEVLQLDSKTGLPLEVAGVPPDYFSETGQRWGNPLYRWFDSKGGLNEPTYLWWKRRVAHLSALVDIVRIDHFRGFESYWAIPYTEKTAIKGKWIKGPGFDFFKRLKAELGDLPLIAEDLGVITPEVETLRDSMNLPGMKILQFAFDFNNKNSYLPNNYDNPNCFVYTGTHDNNTTNGWFYEGEIDKETQEYILDYIGSDSFSDFHIKLIKLAYRSTARTVIIPAQDVLGFGKDFKMNKPGTVNYNWRWKLTSSCFRDEHIQMLKKYCDMYNRIPENKSIKG